VLAFSSTQVRVNRKWLLAIAVVTMLTVNAVAVMEIHSLYYLTGNAAKDYDTTLVRQAGSTAEAAKVFLVRAGKRQWVMQASWISSHGYRWPDDIVTIFGITVGIRFPRVSQSVNQ
jgi:hypothetical protein